MAIWVMNIKLNLVDMLKCMDICSLYQKEILKNIFYYVIDISINIDGVYAFDEMKSWKPYRKHNCNLRCDISKFLGIVFYFFHTTNYNSIGMENPLNRKEKEKI